MGNQRPERPERPDYIKTEGSEKRAGMDVQPEEVTNPQVYSAPQRVLVLDDKYAKVIPVSSVTPNVSHVEHFHTINTGAVTITDFAGGQPHQTLNIKGDGFTTVQHGTNIFTNTAADKLLAANKIYTFTRFETSPGSKIYHWYEGA